MSDSVKTKSLFGPASFYKQALSIAMPVMLQQLIMNLVSLIDNFMVAGLGDAKMAAVNVANQLNFVFFVLTFTLCAAGGIFLSQFRGAQNPEGMQQAFRFKLILSSLISIIYMGLCQLFPKFLIGIMTKGNSAQAEIVAHGAQYLKIVSLMWLPFGWNVSMASSFRETGNTKPPLYFSIAATLVNTVFNWLLIYGNLGAPRLEILGAAVATNLARGVEFVLFVVYARIKKPEFFFRVRNLFKLNLKIFWAVFGRSWLMIFSEFTWVVTETVTTAVYNGRGGADVVAGLAAGWTIANVFFLVFGAIHTATGVIVGATLGADRLDEARQKARWIKSGAFVFGAFVSVFEFASILVIPLVFGNLSSEARGVTAGLIALIACYMPLWSLLNAQFAVARSGGDAIMGFFVDVVINLLIFIPSVFLLAHFTPLSPVFIFGLVKLSDILKAAVAQWWLKKERWVVNLAKAHAQEEPA